MEITQQRDSKPVIVRQVWEYNLEYEFGLIRQAVKDHRYIAMDTEFPGVIFEPTVDRRLLKPFDHYRCMKANVDALKLIQLGLTLTDVRGNLPDFETESRYIWEFNFRDFNVEYDFHNRDSITMLRLQGIDFDRNVSHGVDSFHFSQLMLRSRLVFNTSIVWVTFHSTYDFGYLVKILTRNNLPNRLEDFLTVLRMYFGRAINDMKHMIRYCNSLYGGLERVASALNVERIVGKTHQAASDSLLTWQSFQKMVPKYFPDKEGVKHAGVLFGLEVVAR